MKKLLKPDDETTIQRWHDNHHTARMLKALKSWSDLEVGEVLVRRDVSSGNLVEVSGTCKVPQKFKIVHIDNLGVPWIKRMSVRGGLSSKLYPMTHFEPERFTFEVDPEKIDAMLLGIKYDARLEYKRMRDSNPNYSKNKDE